MTVTMESTTSADLKSLAAEKSEIQDQDAQDQDPRVRSMAINGSDEQKRGVKRSAEGPLDVADEVTNGSEDHGRRVTPRIEDEYVDEETAAPEASEDPEDVEMATVPEQKPLSKNQLRKLKRQQQWEEGRQHRKEKRKEKKKNKQARDRIKREAEIALAAKEGREPVLSSRERDRNAETKTLVPVTIILDCQYEKYMKLKELTSLSSQVVRSYSDNRTAQYPVHLWISSYGGKLEERFNTVLDGQWKKWKGVTLTDQDFVQAGKSAQEQMAGPKGGTTIELLQSKNTNDCLKWTATKEDTNPKKKITVWPIPAPEPDDVDKSIVYLTPDSPYTLDRLEPNTSYVIGGIIDRNREKGLCYGVARRKNVRTAKLPIGEYMVLQDRHVLATNHVVEIMLRWLELGDWGAAFMKVIPTRKGGKLKDATEGSENATEDGASPAAAGEAAGTK